MNDILVLLYYDEHYLINYYLFGVVLNNINLIYGHDNEYFRFMIIYIFVYDIN